MKDPKAKKEKIADGTTISYPSLIKSTRFMENRLVD